MKIAFLSIYNGIADRGAETFVKEICCRLAKRAKVDVYQGGEKAEGYNIVRIPVLWILPTSKSNLFWRILHKFYLDPHSLNVFFFTLRVLPHLLKYKYDVVVPVSGFWQVVLVKIAGIFSHFKIVISGQAGVGRDDWWNLRLHPDGFFALTTHQKEWAKAQSEEETIVETVPNGVDLKKFQAEGPKIKINLSRPIVLTVAALVDYKNIDLTIEAVARTNFSLLIVGSGPLYNSLQNLGEEMLESRFLIKQFPYDEMPSVYRSCDLFTLASESSEAFGIAYVEAMATSLPVVAPSDVSRREIIGRAGILTDCHNSSSYALALKKVVGRNWGNTVREQAEKFDWDKIADKFYRTVSKIENG